MNWSETQSLASRSLGKIAAILPAATAVFRKHKLDFCCGGFEGLEPAVVDNGLDLAVIEEELATLSSGPRRLAESVEGLILHILDRYHAVHRRDLSELRRLARRVESVHADHPAVPKRLADRLAAMQAKLESYMQKEEQILSPLMRGSGSPTVGYPIAVTRAEHERAKGELQVLTAATIGRTLPVEACSTWCALYAGFERFAEDLTEHIHIENNILFPRFEV